MSAFPQTQPQYIAIYRLLKAALFSMSHHYNHNGHEIKITFDSCSVILSDSLCSYYQCVLPNLFDTLHFKFVMSNCKMPYLDWQYAPLVESYEAFKARMELYFIDHAIIYDNKKAV